MDPTMVFILSIINLIVVLLFITSILAIANYGDKSKAKHEQIRDEAEPGITPEKSQYAEKSDIDKVMKSIVGLEQSFKPLVEITQRHERILSGSQSKGALGEQLVGERLADLPHSWYDCNVQFQNGARVEFALRAPNGRWVPIDSKWTATELLNQLGQATDPAQRNELKTLVQREVINRARDAMKFVDKESTLGFCIVAVPDPVFEFCVDIQAKLTSADIVLISYSLLVPYILLLVNLYLKNNQAAQVLEISSILNRSTAQIELIQDYINKQVVPPLGVVKQQQANYGLQNRGLEDIHEKVSKIQNELSLLKSMINLYPAQILVQFQKPYNGL